VQSKYSWPLRLILQRCAACSQMATVLHGTAQLRSVRTRLSQNSRSGVNCTTLLLVWSLL
jgi:hypothetical protein